MSIQIALGVIALSVGLMAGVHFFGTARALAELRQIANHLGRIADRNDHRLTDLRR